MTLSNEQKLKKLARLAEADQPIKVFERLEKLDEDTEKLSEKDQEMAKTIDGLASETEQSLTAISTGLKALDEKKADRQELEQKINQIELKEGPKGDDYVLTETDKKEIAGKITVPIVEKIIERTEVIKEQPIVTNEIKEVAVADTPDQIRDKLESLQDDQRLSISAIHKLEEILDELRRRPVGGRVGGGFSKIALESKIIDDETPTNSGDNLNFTIANTPNPSSSFKLYRGGARQRVTEDYTLSGRNLILSIALVSGEILLCDYRI